MRTVLAFLILSATACASTVSLYQGQAFTLHANVAIGTPPYQFQWWSNGWALNGETAQDYHTTASILGQTLYWCVVVNQAGTTTSDLAYVYVSNVPLPPPPAGKTTDELCADAAAEVGCGYDAGWHTFNNVTLARAHSLHAALVARGL